METEAKALAPSDRQALRGEQAAPILERSKGWLDDQADRVLPKGPIGEAVGYARAQWTALTRYVQDGTLAINNNLSERALRRVVVGRANWLFCGSDEWWPPRGDPVQPRGDLQGVRRGRLGVTQGRVRANPHSSQSPPGRVAATELEGGGS